MKRMRKYISAVLLFCLLFTAINISADEEMPENSFKAGYQEEKDEYSADYKDNEIIVKTNNEATAANIANRFQPLQSFNVTATKTTRFNNEIKLTDTETEQREEIIVLDISGENMKTVLDELNNEEGVIYAQPNYKVFTSSVDEKLWAVQNTGQTVDESMGVGGVDINLLEAWDLTKGSESVIIGVIDTGVDINHPALADNIWNNPNEVADGADNDGNGYTDDIHGWDFVNNDNSVYDSATADEHGTHVAGIIAGNLGVAPNVKIMPLKAFSGNYGYTSDILNAIAYAENMGAKIVNCSFASDEYNYALAAAINESDMLFVCAAGNFARSTKELFSFPACYNFDNTISVSAVNNKGELSPTSTYGKYIDIAAPGVGIYSTLPNNSYGYKNGTSMAAAYVSGSAALLLSRDESLTAKQLKDALIAGATTEIISPEETVEPESLINVNNALLYEQPQEDEILKPSTGEILDISEYAAQRQYPFEFTVNNGNLELSIYNSDEYDSLTVKINDIEDEEIYFVETDNSETEFIISDWEIDTEYSFSITFKAGNHILYYIGNVILFGESGELFVNFYNVMKQEYNEPSEDEENGDFTLMSAGTINENDVGEFGGTFSTARTVYDDYDVYGSLYPSGDTDYFKITFNTAGVANFYLANIPSGCKYKLYLYDSNQNYLVSSTSSSGYEIIPYRGVAAATYYIQIGGQGTYSQSQYLFRAKWYPQAIGTEPNDSFATAATIGSNSVTNANINTPDDVDFYKFTTSGTTLVNINLVKHNKI